MKKRIITLTVSALIVAAMVIGCIPAYAAEVMEDIPTIQSFTDDPVAQEDLAKIVNAGVNAPSAINQQPWHFSVVTDPAVMEQINGGGSSGDSGDSEAADAAEGESAGGEDAAASEGGESEGGEDAAASEGGEDAAAAPAASTSAKASVGDSPVVIIISAAAEATGTTPAYDAGLATMSMAAEAALLGYGTKIVTSPTMTLNADGSDELHQTLGIPAGYTVVGVLLIGVSAQDEADVVSSASTRNADDVVTFVAP